MRETQQDLIEVLKGLTKEIRQLREEFNPQIRASKIIELKEAEDKRESNAIARAVQRFEERKAKNMSCHGGRMNAPFDSDKERARVLEYLDSFEFYQIPDLTDAQALILDSHPVTDSVLLEEHDIRDL